MSRIKADADVGSRSQQLCMTVGDDKAQINCCIELVGAIIKQAISDLRYVTHDDPSMAKIGRDAQRFLNGKRLEEWCGTLGVNADYIRRQVDKTFNLPELMDGTKRKCGLKMVRRKA